MSLLGCLDALQVHAAAAAVSAGGATFTDVEVGSSAAKGRCVRVYYDGERQSAYFGPSVLNAQLIAHVVTVEAIWPTADSGTKRQRFDEGEMGAFAASFRGRVNGDFTLGGNCIVAHMLPAVADGPVMSKVKYARLTWEVGLDISDDYIYAP